MMTSWPQPPLPGCRGIAEFGVKSIGHYSLLFRERAIHMLTHSAMSGRRGEEGMNAVLMSRGV